MDLSKLLHLSPAWHAPARRLLLGLLGLTLAWGLWLGLLLPLLQLGLPEAAHSPVRRVGLLLLALAVYAWLHGLQALRPRWGLTAASAGAAVAQIGVCLGLLLALGAYRIEGVRSPAWDPIMVILVAALLEELVYRAWLMQALAEAWGARTALALQALLFGAVHLANGGASATTLVSVTLLGLLWGAIYLRWRNLWVVWAHHAAWNLSIFLSGAPLSGSAEWQPLAALQLRDLGPAWLSGGAFGPEDSLPCLLVLSLSLVVMALGSARADRA